MAGMLGASRADSRITRVHTRVLDLPLPADFHPAWGRNEIQRSFYMTLVEVETAAGITGVTAAEAGLEAAASIERFVSPHLIGRDAAAPERLTPVLRDAEILGSPVYCVEVALWDIAGKIARLPVYKMWGAATDRVPAYCATGEVRSPERRVEDCRRIKAEGFKAVKLRFHSDDPRDDIRVVEAIRRARRECRSPHGPAHVDAWHRSAGEPAPRGFHPQPLLVRVSTRAAGMARRRLEPDAREQALDRRRRLRARTGRARFRIRAGRGADPASHRGELRLTAARHPLTNGRAANTVGRIWNAPIPPFGLVCSRTRCPTGRSRRCPTGPRAQASSRTWRSGSAGIRRRPIAARQSCSPRMAD